MMHMHLSQAAVVAVALAAASCATTSETPETPPAKSEAQAAAPAATADEPAPKGKLPEGVRPLAYRLDLTIVPEEERFSGTTSIDMELDAPRAVIWLHGAGLDVSEVGFTPATGQRTAGTFEQVTELGLAKVTFPAPLPKGQGVLDFTYSAPFDQELKGIYKLKDGDDAYVFTQMEATSARFAFPSFDEPRFKVPFDVSITSKTEHVVVANTLETSTAPAGEGRVKHSFAKTAPLPTYLIALAVGPLEVVEAAPIPANAVRQTPLRFRGVAAKGRSEKLAYALRETPKILAELEAYFGSPYPFDKLDILAVPDFAAGAMENVGAVTFREYLLLVDEKDAPLSQKRSFAGVMAHELAHMWFGNLVTMPWWDDIWLNEAFATWMAFKIVDRVYPEYEAPLGFVNRSQGAMSQDSLVAARQIRQPIESDHDIENAFDSITYSKGGAVLSMFERWLSEPVFRDGIRRYMKKHASGNATCDDLLAALSEASGKDVGTPFRTFLFQPGVPLVEADLVCDASGAKLDLTQRRYLPAGSTGDPDQTWQIPVCARFGSGKSSDEACTLLTEKTGVLDLGAKTGGACPDWVMPNAAHAGYYRWTLPNDDLARLTLPAPHHKGRGKSQVAVPPNLDVAEWSAVADAVRTAFNLGRLSTADTLAAFAPMALHPHRSVATAPLGTLGFIHERLVDDDLRPKVEEYIRKTYRPALDRLGLEAKRDESAETRGLRADLARFLLLTGNDQDLEKKLVPYGRTALGLEAKPEPDADLAAVAAAAAVRADPAVFDAAKELLKTEKDPIKRGRALGALPLTRDAKRAEEARALMFDDRVRTNEVGQILFGSFQLPERRKAAWAFVTTKYDDVAARLPTFGRGSLPWVGSFFCSSAEADEVETFFRPRVKDLIGGPRNLDGSVEAVRLCSARVELQRASAVSFFQAGAPAPKHAQR